MDEELKKELERELTENKDQIIEQFLKDLKNEAVATFQRELDSDSKIPESLKKMILNAYILGFEQCIEVMKINFDVELNAATKREFLARIAQLLNI